MSFIDRVNKRIEQIGVVEADNLLEHYIMSWKGKKYKTTSSDYCYFHNERNIEGVGGLSWSLCKKCACDVFCLSSKKVRPIIKILNQKI